MSFFEELKRRNVVRVGIAYIIASWLLLQLTEVLIELLDLPDVAGRFVILLLIVGFIPALIFAWAFEMTPEGIKREKDVDRSQSVTNKTGRKMDRSIIAVLVLAVAYFVYDKFQAEDPPTTTVAVETTSQSAMPVEAEEVQIDPSIAVLPFTDLSAEQDQGYFSDGISEELLNVLVRVEGLKVASRTSSFTYKGSNQSLAEIAKELKVDHILEGSVRKADNRVRITAQLIDAKTDRHLWSETFDRDLVDIFAIQDEIANAIVEALRAELGMLQDAPAISVDAATENLDAYELYLKARGLFIARDKLEESIALFERAVALDPEFARAWEGLAAVYNVARSWGITDRDYDAMATVAAKKALDLNPELSMPHAVMGSQASNTDKDRIAAIEHLDRAIEIDRMNTTAYLWRGITWGNLGFFDKAINDTTHCLDLDPRYENCRRHLAIFNLATGHTDVALKLFQITAERGFKGAWGTYAYELIKRGNRLAATLAVRSRFDDERSYPAKIYLDALEFPEKDHSDDLKKFLHWVKNHETYNDPADWPQELFALGEYKYAKSLEFNSFWIWQEQYKPFRESSYFKPYIRESGYLEYWRAKGFPPQCRAVGEDDFECD